MVKKNIENTIRKHNLINKGEHIVIGLSGGPDSVCLFSVLKDLSTEMDFIIHAVHVNHGFRPGDAEADQQYVEDLCRESGIECTSYTFDCNAIAKEEGLGSEETGRKVRYRSFVETAERIAAGGVAAEKIRIAVAQNADDQAETVLFRLLRGTGTDGLAGMAYSRMENGFSVIRPLLDTWRKDIEAYCRDNGLRPRTDKTNLEPIYTRNKIRLQLIPYLQENFNPNIMEALGRLSRIAGEDKDYLWECAEEAYSGAYVSPGILRQAALTEAAPAVRHRVVMKALGEQGMEQDLTAAHLEAIDSILDAQGESRTVELPDGYRVSVRYGEVAFYCVDTEPLSQSNCYKNAGFSAKVLPNDENPAGGGTLDGTWASADVRDEAAPHSTREAGMTAAKQTAVFDYSKITEAHGDADVQFRSRRPGDYIAIKGGRKKIQDLFVDMKVPKENRDSVKFAAIGSEVLWIPQQPENGVIRARYNHSYKLDMDTKKRLELEMNCDI